MPAVLVHPPMLLVVFVTLAGAVAMLTWRAHEARRVVTVRSVIIPPLGMSTGFSMFAVPATRVPLSWAVVALALGALVFAIPLISTSRLVRQDEQILVQRSRAFVAILLGLVALRFGLRTWIEQYVSPMQTGALFFLLAFGAIVRWRLAMLRDYRRLIGDEVRTATSLP
ncbi:MAG TPA: cytochrome c biogenesis protein CcdC [Kofleriaceae bacterium]|nr:cytochrome c biogenesis protein CcdC [Kofleriaceae bacterium]